MYASSVSMCVYVLQFAQPEALNTETLAETAVPSSCQNTSAIHPSIHPSIHTHRLVFVCVVLKKENFNIIHDSASLRASK